MHMEFCVNVSFRNAFFHWGPLLKYVGLRKCILWTSIWDSGFQQMHIQIFGESHFSNASLLLGLLPKYAGLQKIIF